jgi:hypothetical protein
MAQYRRRNRIQSPYQQRHGDGPYRSQTGELYRKLLDRYKQHRPTGGSPRRGDGSKYRSNVVRYHSGSGYKSKAKEDTRSQVITRREPSPRIEFPEYRPDHPDVEVLLKELEKRFDERLHERVLEMMEKEFVEARAEILRRYDLPDTATDEDLRERIDKLSDSEKSKQQKEHFIEHPPDVAENGPDIIRGSEKNAPESTVEADPEQMNTPSQSSLLETIEAAPQLRESDNVSEVESPSISELAHAEVETPSPEHTSESRVASPDRAAEPIEVAMLEDRLLLSDIEALYNELETEQESEEEVEPTY